MPDNRTTVTELVTGLGMLGHDSIDEALAARPRQMVSASPELWDRLDAAWQGGALAQEFHAAWNNGRAFLRATDALRGRVPVVIEWKGGHRAPGDEVVPADLRVDHVYLVSCKYLSRILHNAAPRQLFERLLAGGQGRRGRDWYEEVAPVEYRALYEHVRDADLPALPDDLTRDDRRALRERLGGGWPGTDEPYRDLCAAVSMVSAARWTAAMATPAEQQAMLWRLLRIGSAPYFVLGSARERTLRLRIATPWDWRSAFELRSFTVEAQPGGQPRVGWCAVVRERHTGAERSVSGHVEIRWSHGRFGAPPEAKVYLDTPHHEVPGYFPLV
jgi:hypothetical protein